MASSNTPLRPFCLFPGGQRSPNLQQSTSSRVERGGRGHSGAWPNGVVKGSKGFAIWLGQSVRDPASAGREKGCLSATGGHGALSTLPSSRSHRFIRRLATATKDCFPGPTRKSDMGPVTRDPWPPSLGVLPDSNNPTSSLFASLHLSFPKQPDSSYPAGIPKHNSRLTARLEIFHRPNLPRALHAHGVRYGRKTPLFEPLERDGIVAQVELGPDEDDGRAGAVV